jgi:hypothetical protein
VLVAAMAVSPKVFVSTPASSENFFYRMWMDAQACEEG